MSRKLAAVFAVALSGLLSSSAHAFVPSSSAILAGIANRRASVPFKNLVLEGQTRVGDSPPVEVWEAILAGEAHRVERKTGEAATVTLTRGTKRWTFSMGSRAEAPKTIPPDVIMTFYARADKDPGAQRGLAFLAAYGIDSSVVTMSRLGRDIVYVIGAKPWETTKPQLWISKESMLPVRFIHMDKDSGATTDIRLLEVQSPITFERYPRRIEIWSNNSLVETITYRSLEVDEDLEPSLFRPPA